MDFENRASRCWRRPLCMCYDLKIVRLLGGSVGLQLALDSKSLLAGNESDRLVVCGSNIEFWRFRGVCVGVEIPLLGWSSEDSPVEMERDEILCGGG